LKTTLTSRLSDLVSKQVPLTATFVDVVIAAAAVIGVISYVHWNRELKGVGFNK